MTAGERKTQYCAVVLGGGKVSLARAQGYRGGRSNNASVNWMAIKIELGRSLATHPMRRCISRLRPSPLECLRTSYRACVSIGQGRSSATIVTTFVLRCKSVCDDSKTRPPPLQDSAMLQGDQSPRTRLAPPCGTLWAGRVTRQTLLIKPNGRSP